MSEIWPDCMIATGSEGVAAFSCRGYGSLLAERDALAARLAEVRNEIKSLTELVVAIGDDEHTRLIPDLAFRVVRIRDKVVFAQHGETGRAWRGKRKDIPAGYSEIEA